MANAERSEEEWIRSLSDLAGTTISDQVRAAQRGANIVRHYGRGELTTSALWDETTRFARDETLRYARNATLFGASYFEALARIGGAYTGLVADAASQAQAAPARQAASPAPRERFTETRLVTVELSAPIGQTATRSLLLENAFETTAQITFLTSDWESSAGDVPFRADLRFDPPRMALAPGESRHVTLSLFFNRESFAADRRYTAQVLVRGYNETELILVALPSPEELPSVAPDIAAPLAEAGVNSDISEEPTPEVAPARVRRKAVK